MEEKKITTFTTPILVVLLVIAAFLVGMFWTKIQYLEQGKTPKEIVQASPTPVEEATLGEGLVSTVGNFLITEDEVCEEEGKPIVYFFGGSFCPHCQWEHPIVQGVAKKFENYISFHDNMDSQEADQEVWNKYSQINQGGVPFLVFGCRYVRVGSGETAGEETEKENLTALICKLTGGEPTAVCEEVADLIEQIE